MSQLDTLKPVAFWFHYNKPASQQQQRNVLSIHCQKQCYLVHDIICEVPIRTRHGKTQPRCKMAGRGRVTVVEGRAIIKAS